MRGRGFTFAEVVVVATLSSFLVMLGLYGLTGTRTRATSFGMAAVVAAEMEAAKAMAASSGQPVAFCVPSGGGSVPNSQSFYLMTGEARPKLLRQRSLAGDFPESSLAMVFWDPATLTPATHGRAATADSAVRWLDRRAGSDFALIFMPDGTVMSNGLPVMNGEYRVVVAASFVATAAQPSGRFVPGYPPPRNYRLQEVFAPQTVCLSAQGEIRVVAGIPDGTGVKISTGGLPQTSPPAGLVDAETSDSTQPEALSVAVYPKPFLEPKATVMKDRNLTLQIEAADEDGQPLFGSWKATPVGSAQGEGQFSLASDHPLVWDKKLRRWTGQCTWAPPLEAEVGDQYTLSFTVKDSDGNEDELTAEVLNPVTIIPPGRILFERARGTRADVAIINADGTSLRYLTQGAADDTGPSVSPDGSQIAWVNKNDVSNGTYGQVYVMNIDGTGQRRVTNTMAIKGSPSWTPDGLKLVYMRAFRSASGNVIGDGDLLRWCNPDGSGEATLGTLQGSSSYSTVFSPDGMYLVNVANMGGGGAPSISGELIVSEYRRDGTAPPELRDPTNVTNDSGLRASDGLPAFLPTGTGARILWPKSKPGPSGNYSDSIQTLNLATIQDNGAGTPRFELVDSQVILNQALSSLVFSPDGKKVLYVKPYPSQGIFVADWTDGPTPTLSNERRLTGLSGTETPRAWMKF